MTILDTYIVHGLTSNITVCLLLIFAAFVLGVLGYLIVDNSIAAGIMTGCIFFAGTMMLLFFTGYFKPHTRYEVTIDDSVPFVEIYEKYDVIDHHGDIYVLEEKDDNN